MRRNLNNSSMLDDIEPPSGGSERRLALGLTAVLSGTVILALADIAGDLDAGVGYVHLVLEGALAVGALTGLVLLLRRIRGLSRSAAVWRSRAAGLADQLSATAADAAHWRGEARVLLAGLGAAIDSQFDRWHLTAAEKEVALLLLKGLSHKEVAAARGISEATARQQAGSVYRKAGVTGRPDLAAFFLEDLLLPSTPPAGPRETP